MLEYRRLEVAEVPGLQEGSHHMKVQIVVKLKEGVLDPQGQAIHRSLRKLGHENVSKVRQGRYFELEIDDQDSAVVKKLSEQIAADVLSNPIIEDFEIRQVS